MGRIVLILLALLAADAYFWHGKNTRMAMQTAAGFASEFNYQVDRLLQRLHRG